MYRHIKNSCAKNKDESFKEMARLMNEIENIKKENEDQNKKYKALEKQLKTAKNNLLLMCYNGRNKLDLQKICISNELEPN